jgi:hypothetical protein
MSECEKEKKCDDECEQNEAARLCGLVALVNVVLRYYPVKSSGDLECRRTSEQY